MNLLLKYYPVILILLAFTPYISVGGGLKIEDFVIYPLAILVILTVLLKKEIKINSSILGLFISWSAISFYMFIRTLIGGGQISIQTFLADINNLAQPLAIMLLFLLVVRSKSKNETLDILKFVSYSLLIMLSLNTLWTILGFFINLDPINAFFWGSNESVASLAATMGRFSGIFNQPIEAGMAYLIGLLVWLYVIEKKYMKIGIKAVLILLLLIIGGSLTVSKVFVVLGLVLFTLGVITNKVVIRSIIKIFLLIVVLGYPAYLYFIKTWDGLNYLLRLFDGSNYQTQGVLNLLTAGRYGGADSQQGDYFARIWSESPIIGEGMGSQLTYDSAHFYFFSMGGSIGLLGYIVIITVFAWLIYDTYAYTKLGSEFKLFLGIFILIVAGGLGAPALTLNRSSIIMWVFIGLIIQYLCNIKTERFMQKNIVVDEKKLLSRR